MIKILDLILSKIFPDEFNCIICDEELAEPNRIGLCPVCDKTISRIGPDKCVKCGVQTDDLAEFCLNCQNIGRDFSVARSAVVFEYGSEVQRLIHRLKFGGKRYLAKYMAAFLVDVFIDEGMDADLVIPVPLSQKRRKKRGFNQAEEIAKHFAEKLKLDFKAGAVIKIRDSVEFATLNAKERAAAVKGLFEVADKESVRGLKVLIIDDVFTTGATTNEISSVLKKAGAGKVSVLTFASTKKPLPVEKGDKTDEEA